MIATHLITTKILGGLSIAIYGLLFGLASYLFYYSIKSWIHKSDDFGGKMWRAVIWLQLGLIIGSITGFISRYEAFINDINDYKLGLSFLTSLTLLIGEILSTILIRHREENRDY